MKRFFPLLLLTFILFSCGEQERYKSNGTYISGEIVNPKRDYVLLLYKGTILDSIKLDNANRFTYRNDSLQNDLYSFWHNEYQTFYIEPNDSIVIRVNTIDFDESLHFSGTLADENNLLLNLFLANEKSTEYLESVLHIPPNEFEKKSDSIYKQNYILLDNYKKRKNKKNHPTVTTIATQNLNYNNYLKRELYVSAKNKDLEPLYTIPNGFLAHRKKISFYNETLRFYYPYFRFINQYMDNLAFEAYKNPENFSRRKYEHVWHKLAVIDTTKMIPELKNTLSEVTTSNYLRHSKTETKEQKIVTKFFNINTNSDHHKEIETLYEICKKQLPGKHIPSVALVNTDDQRLIIDDLIDNKPMLLYFWSYNSFKQSKNLHTKAQELASKYPEYNFIAININNDYEKWKNSVNTSDNLNHLTTYQLANKEEAKKQIIYSSNGKCIILDKKGDILNGHANLYARDIEQQLLGFLNSN